ncbi:UNVERIFIED_CONTAM: Ndufa9 [Trichonephila clavipes]
MMKTFKGHNSFSQEKIGNGKHGTQVIIPYRGDPYLVTRLKLCGDLGQILFTHFNLKDEESLYKSMKHSNIVINLIGKSFETSYV